MNTNDAISLRILSLVAGGMDLPSAYDAVLGDGAYSSLASAIFDGLRE
jgi:hypothetical protein